MLRPMYHVTLYFMYVVILLCFIVACQFIINLNDFHDSCQSILTNNYESSNVDSILDEVRSKVRCELSSYNYSTSGVHQLEDLVMEAGGEPKRSLIISTWRSGSTFLGALLNAMPSNFYHYEPLMNYQIIQIRGPPHGQKAINTIKNMFKCDFDNEDGYFENGKIYPSYFSWNSRLSAHCKINTDLCLNADFTGRFCKMFPFQSMKIIRFRLRLAEELLADKRMNIKVVVLIRDPRAVMQSRQDRGYCLTASDCRNPELLCEDMVSDYVTAVKLLQLYPNKLMLLRYEELALDPHNKTQELFRFLGLELTPSVRSFLDTHTRYQQTGPRSTFRVSRNMPFRWKKLIKYSYMSKVQHVCKKAMNLWGYREVHNISQMLSEDFDPLMPCSI